MAVAKTSVIVLEEGDVEVVHAGLCGGECRVILKSLLRRISELEDAVDSLR